MPIRACTLRGNKGWKFGQAGSCFTGPDAHEQARQQGLAVLTSQAKAAGAKSKADIEAHIAAHGNELADE